MIVIIPLGGIGDRFKKNGYNKPKALINVFGKSIIYYLIDNLNLTNIDFVCIPYNKEYAEYDFEEKIQKKYPTILFKFLKLTFNTEGAAETINIALKTFTVDDRPIICLDSDNFYTIDIIRLWNGENKIITFEDLCKNEIYSYLNVENNKVIDIVEKQKISNHACCGAYGFSSYKQLLIYTQKILDNQIKQKNEYYTSTVIKEMIKDGIDFYNLQIDKEKYHCLGTPIQLRYFYNNYPKIKCINNSSNMTKQRICFDLDNTLVTSPKVKNDYRTVEPIEKNIKLLKYIKSFGNTIIIYTARRMKTHSGNIGKCLSDIGQITFDTLQRFHIPYDEIYFGKPYADVYIDDLALNCYDNLEKELGFYLDNIMPRDFNKLETNSIETYKKISNNLSGEIYYYQNIPYSIKDLFPILLDWDADDNKWYTMNKINGITVTNLFLNELLTPTTLIHIMNSLTRIHVTDISNYDISNLNIYENYCNKIKERYLLYDYTSFKDQDKMYEYLVENLSLYENNKQGKCSVIHGDSVMTNILINHLEKIKFIDMRGKVGDQLTICGDLFYDWAKLYQSLIGYDKILLGKTISQSYEKLMIDTFEEYFLQKFSNIDLLHVKIITKSLLFALIPLHNNNLCYEYYNLINTF
jgi:capsule biosynthesis phosphatase